MKKQIDAIFAADIHLRDTIPVARIDDYWKAQSFKFAFILELAHEYKVPLFIAGDFFDTPKVSPYLEQWVIKTIRECGKPDIYVVPGQHDLPNHNLDLIEKSSLKVLESALSLEIYKVPWDTGYKEIEFEGAAKRKIIMMHTMVHKEVPIHDKVKSTKAVTLLRKYPDADLILTGDNHESFVFESNKRILVNPGSVMRMDADQIKHKPVVYLYSARLNTVEPVYIPVEKVVLSREHLEKKNVKDKKIQSFIRRIKDDYEIGISFRRNVKSFLERNNEKIRPPVQKLVWKIIDQDE